jgi:tetratricopeptide (TPR) repeat protein
MSVLRDIIDSIKNKKMVIFYGAGISINSPSNLPSAIAIRKVIIKYVFGDTPIPIDARDRLELGYVRSQNVTSQYLHLPFEAFLEDVIKHSSLFDTLVEIFRSGNPNKNHHLIAFLLMKGYVQVAITTNFDVKVEQVLENKGWKKGRDFKVVFKESDFHATILDSTNIPTIIKVHGSVEDVTTIRTTISNIYRKEFLQTRSRLITHVFSELENDILMMGYSCSDEFDINPSLRSLQSPNQIYYLKHMEQLIEPEIKPLSDPLTHFKGSLICYNTNYFVNRIWNEFISEEWVPSEEPSIWEEKIDDWGQSLIYVQKAGIVGDLLFSINEFIQAKTVLEQLLEVYRDIYQEHDLSFGITLTLDRLGDIYDILQMNDEAEKANQENLEIKRKLQDNTRESELGIAQSLHQLANNLQNRSEYDRAEQLFNESLALKEKWDDKIGISRTLHQLGLIRYHQERDDDAEDLFLRSISVKQEAGNLSGELHSHFALSNLYFRINKYASAEAGFQRCVQIGTMLGSQQIVAGSFHQLGLIKLFQNKDNEAEKLFNQSITANLIAIDSKAKSNRAMTFYLLSRIQLKRHQPYNAMVCLENCLTIEERNENLDLISKALKDIISITYALNRFKKSTEYCIRLIHILVKMSNYKQARLQLPILGYIAEMQGAFYKAVLVYEFALNCLQGDNDDLCAKLTSEIKRLRGVLTIDSQFVGLAKRAHILS